jgi:hypothetical protein
MDSYAANLCNTQTMMCWGRRAPVAQVLTYQPTRELALSIKKRIDAEENFCAPVKDAEFKIVEVPC